MALEKHRAEMMALLLEEAAKNLAGMMHTAEAEKLQVRHFLPDELDGCAIMLRNAYGIEVPNSQVQRDAGFGGLTFDKENI